MSEEQDAAITVSDFWEKTRKVVDYHDYHFGTSRWKNETFEQKVEQMNQAAQQFGLPDVSPKECHAMLARLNDMCIIDLKMKLTAYMGEPQRFRPEGFKDIVARQRNFR